MKKHEACYHLNDIRRGLLEDARRYQENPHDKKYVYETKSWRPATEEESEESRKTAEKRISEINEKITALDIAGDALTR